MKRQIPNDLPYEKVVTNIEFIEKVIGKEWLNKSGNKYNALRELWLRTDFLSTIELYTLGTALKNIECNENRDWINDFIKQIKSSNHDNIVGVCFEAIAYSLYSSDNEAMLSKPGQPGYDFSAKTDAGEVRFSCKKLQESDEEKKLKQEFKYIEKVFKEQLTKYRLTGKQLFFYSHRNSRVPSRNALKKHISRVVSENVKQSRIGEFDILLKDLSSDVEGFNFTDLEPSYAVNMVAAHSSNEQKRFERLFKNAVKNISKHSTVEPGKSVNAIIMSLPESISIEKARGWLENKFKSDGSKVGFVMLIRSLPANSKDDNSTVTVHEIGLVVNLNSTSTLLDLINKKAGDYFKLSVPVGVVSMKECQNVIYSDIGSMDVSSSYIFQKAAFNYHCNLVEPADFNINAQPSCSYALYVEQRGNNKIRKIEFIRPPESNFVLL
ncbi:hypothetical protein AB6C44_20210 [Vibrio splendidus]